MVLNVKLSKKTNKILLVLLLLVDEATYQAWRRIIILLGLLLVLQINATIYFTRTWHQWKYYDKYWFVYSCGLHHYSCGSSTFTKAKLILLRKNISSTAHYSLIGTSSTLCFCRLNLQRNSFDCRNARNSIAFTESKLDQKCSSETHPSGKSSDCFIFTLHVCFVCTNRRAWLWKHNDCWCTEGQR